MKKLINTNPVNCFGAAVLALTVCVLVFFIIEYENNALSTFGTSTENGLEKQNRKAAGRTFDGSNLQANSNNPSDSLRILYHKRFRGGFGISSSEKELIEKFAIENQLSPVWIEVKQRWELLPAIYQNKGDVIISQSYDVAGGLKGIVSFTEPWGNYKYQVVARVEQNKSSDLFELSGREIAIKRSSRVLKQLNSIAEQHGFKIRFIDENLSEDKILSYVDNGEFDVAILDSGYLSNSIKNYPDLNIILDIPVDQRKAWAVHKNNIELKNQLNEFLNRQLFASFQKEMQFKDLPELKQKGTLRAITYQSPANVFYKDGQLKGFEYELINEFAETHNLRLNVVFANSQDELFELLEQGKGDVITASVPNNSRIKNDYSTSNGYFYSAPMLIGRENEGSPVDLLELNGRRISLSPESPYLELLQTLKKQHSLDFEIVIIDPEINTETLLFMVSLGIHDLTVLPSHTVKAELSRQINLSASIQLSNPEKLVWVTRKQDSKLQAALNNFIEKNYRKLTYNSLKEQYITNPTSFKGDSKLLTKVFNLTPFDEVIKKYSDDHGFDWRLIAAQMYQESQFDPRAISDAGAEGLMQIMPKTAEELGLESLNDPIKNIEAGIRYLSQLRGRFDDDLLLMDRNWFALAAYNAGFRRVSNARKYADKLGLDQDKWFGNVEIAMKEMAKIKTKSDTRICRCGQTVVYVRDIRTRYNNYIGLTDTTEFAKAYNSPQKVALLETLEP